MNYTELGQYIMVLLHSVGKIVSGHFHYQIQRLWDQFLLPAPQICHYRSWQRSYRWLFPCVNEIQAVSLNVSCE